MVVSSWLSVRLTTIKDRSVLLYKASKLFSKSSIMIVGRGIALNFEVFRMGWVGGGCLGDSFAG